MMDDFGIETTLTMIDMDGVMLIESAGCGWAEAMDSNGSMPEIDPVFVLTVSYVTAEDMGKDDGTVKQRLANLAFSPLALDEFIITLARTMLEQDKRRKEEEHE